MGRKTAPLASDSDTPKKNDVQTIDSQSRADTNGESGKDILRNIPHDPKTPQNPQAPRGKKRTYRSREECRDRWKLGIEIATFLVVLGYTIVAYHQWETAIDATDANKIAASAAKTQADAALLSTQTAQKQLELSERPWIKISHRII
jgi:hypothetical protein